MWIRNQKGDRLVQISDIKWEYDNKGDTYYIIGLNDAWIRLGEYLTYEDTIKVFDDIENTLIMSDNPNIVYRMPQWY